MDNRPRTTEDFDNWFEIAGDPWGYRGKPIQARLKRTAKFLQKHLGKDFAGKFLEIGAYDGSFTSRLGYTFPESKIVVNDISGIALNRARDTVSSYPELLSRTEFLLKDSLEITSKDFSESFLNVSEKTTVILLLECLYYLNTKKEREQCLVNLVTLFPDAPVVISVPITGLPYFTEEELISLLKRVGYIVFAIKILTWRRGGRWLPCLGFFVNKIVRLRRSMANQVLYLFYPISGKH
jgi:hypothetical protein